MVEKFKGYCAVDGQGIWGGSVDGGESGGDRIWGYFGSFPSFYFEMNSVRNFDS